MLDSLANTIEQLDLALEHLALGDANNARFALMLCDNVVELTLHRYAKDRRIEREALSRRGRTFEHEKALEKALGRHFEEKIRFSKLTGKIPEDVSESIRIGHLFRNDVYHVGLQHEAILPAVTAFYFALACQICADYEVRSWSYSPDQKIPERTKKYIKEQTYFANFPEEYRMACLRLKASSGHDDKRLVDTLAWHMREIIDEQDEYIDYISNSAPHPQTRDQVIVSCQSWPLAFTEKAKNFATQNGFPGGSHFSLVEWLEKNYPLKFRSDPISAWRRRAERLRGLSDPHRALKVYRSFMDDTAELRGFIGESTIAVDQYIDEQIDLARGR